MQLAHRLAPLVELHLEIVGVQHVAAPFEPDVVGEHRRVGLESSDQVSGRDRCGQSGRLRRDAQKHAVGYLDLTFREHVVHPAALPGKTADAEHDVVRRENHVALVVVEQSARAEFQPFGLALDGHVPRQPRPPVGDVELSLDPGDLDVASVVIVDQELDALEELAIPREPRDARGAGA